MHDDTKDEQTTSHHIEVTDGDTAPEQTKESSKGDALQTAVDAPQKKRGAFRKQHALVGLAVILFSALSFTGGAAYTARQQAQKHEAALRTVTDEKEQLEQKLKEFDLEDDATKEPTDQDEAAAQTDAPAPAPTTTQQTQTKQKEPTTYEKKEPAKNQVQISQAQPAVSGSHVTFTVYLPKTYGTNGYCKVLMKRDGDGAYWTERQVALNGTNTCVIAVPRSELEPSVTNWQAYVLFKDHDTYDYSNWADRKTFTL